MKTFQLQLALKDEPNPITCNCAGHGERIAFVSGAGSFYFNMLDDKLGEMFTFVSYDTFWVYDEDGSSVDENEIKKATKESLKTQDYKIVAALIEHFNVEKLVLFSFSAPGLLALEEFIERPDLFCQAIAIGVGVGMPLDASFSTTTEIFNREASPDRKRRFEEDQEKLQKLNSGTLSENQLSFFNLNSFDQLTPRKKFFTETIPLVAKLVYNRDEKVAKELVVKHWEVNPFQQKINKISQEHFFSAIFPNLDSQQILRKLSEVDGKVLLVFGEKDFITPLLSDIRDRLETYSDIKLEIVAGAAHMPYAEEPNKFSTIVENFIEDKPIYRLSS